MGRILKVTLLKVTLLSPALPRTGVGDAIRFPQWDRILISPVGQDSNPVVETLKFRDLQRACGNRLVDGKASV